MVFNKIRTVKKVLSKLRGRLNWLLKLASKYKKYIIDVLDTESKIKHLERVERSFGLSARGKLEDDGQIVYEVYSSNGQDTYIVNPRKPRHERCECMDCLQYGNFCKHQLYVERVFGVSARLIEKSKPKFKNIKSSTPLTSTSKYDSHELSGAYEAFLVVQDARYWQPALAAFIIDLQTEINEAREVLSINWHNFNPLNQMIKEGYKDKVIQSVIDACNYLYGEDDIEW